MNAYLAVFWGTVGSLAGAYANYYAAHYLGRPLVLRYGRYVGITEHKFAKVERFFLEHGEISTFIGRLFPVVRHLISIPAGLAGMNHLRFSPTRSPAPASGSPSSPPSATCSAPTRN